MLEKNIYNKAMKYLSEILAQVVDNNKESRQRMQDPHLLYYIQDMLDDSAFTALCKLVVDSEFTVLPPMLAQVENLQMILNLSGSCGDRDGDGV
jgi:hypothetical protein